MALRSKLLDERVVNLAKEMLKKVRNNAYVSKKLYQNPLLTEQIRNITNSFNSSTGNIDNKITQNIFK